MTAMSGLCPPKHTTSHADSQRHPASLSALRSHLSWDVVQYYHRLVPLATAFALMVSPTAIPNNFLTI